MSFGFSNSKELFGFSIFLRGSDNVDISRRKNTNTEHLLAVSVSKPPRLFVMLLQRFDQRVCFSRANPIAGPSSSAPSHRFLRLLPRRSHARRIGLAAECSTGTHCSPALEEDDGGEFVLVVERDPSFN